MLSSLQKSLKGGGGETLGALLQRHPAREGYLMKEGGVVKSWRRRYCMLVGSTLHYYKEKRKDAAPAGKVELRGATVQTAGKITGKEHSFEIRAADRTYYFVAESENDRQDWMLALHEATGESLTESEGKRRFAGGSIRNDEETDKREAGNAGDIDGNRFIIHAVSWLITTRGVWAKDLFCKAGVSSEISEIRRQVASGGDADISTMNPYSVATVVKILLSELDPIIPHSLFLRYVAVAEGNKTNDTRQREMKMLLSDLPAVRRETLNLIMNCLRETCKRAPAEGTSADHLAVMFAPLIAPSVDLPNYFPQLADNALLLIAADDIY